MYVLYKYKCKFCGWIPRDNSYESLIDHIMIYHGEEYEEMLAYATHREEFEWQQKKHNVKGVLR